MTRNYQNLIIKTFKASVSVNKMTKKLLEFNYFKTFKASVL